MVLSRKSVLPTLAILFALMLCVTDAMAQPGGRGGRQGGRPGGPGGPRIGGGGFGGGSQFLLRRQDVQKDLELSDEQIESIKKMNQGGGEIDRDALRAELEGLSDEQRREKLTEMRDSRAKENQKKLEEILLPHQVERLAQISAQISALGGARSLTGGALAEKLGITDEQKEKLRSKSEELQKEMNEKIAELRKKMQKELLAELTPEQREQYKEMMGEPFKFERPEGGPGGIRGGGPGARGGAATQGRRGARGPGGRGGDERRRGGRGADRERGGDSDRSDDF